MYWFATSLTRFVLVLPLCFCVVCRHVNQLFTCILMTCVSTRHVVTVDMWPGVTLCGWQDVHMCTKHHNAMTKTEHISLSIHHTYEYQKPGKQSVDLKWIRPISLCRQRPSDRVQLLSNITQPSLVFYEILNSPLSLIICSFTKTNPPPTPSTQTHTTTTKTVIQRKHHYWRKS